MLIYERFMFMIEIIQANDPLHTQDNKITPCNVIEHKLGLFQIKFLIVILSAIILSKGLYGYGLVPLTWLTSYCLTIECLASIKL